MRYDSDPAELTPDEQRQELAAILATGLRRLQNRHVLPADLDSEKLSLSPANMLAVSLETSVTVSPR